jgi:hypothetical protein
MIMQANKAAVSNEPKFSWGVDGHGRQFICEFHGRDQLFCMLPEFHASAGIDLLNEGE